MKKLTFLFLLLCSCTLIFTACATDNRTETEKAIDEAGEDLKEGLKDLEEGLEDMKIEIEGGTEDLGEDLKEAFENLSEALGTDDKDGKKIEVISFRKLKKEMPRRLAGLKQIETSGETKGVAGIKISTAEGVYEKGDRRIELSITDTGGVGSAFMGMAAWANLEIDKETKDEIEYTTKYKGHRAHMKYNKKREKGEYSLIVNKRFIVQLKGRNVSLDDLEDAVRDLDLDDLGD